MKNENLKEIEKVLNQAKKKRDDQKKKVKHKASQDEANIFDAEDIALANLCFEEANEIVFGKKSFSPEDYKLFLKAIESYTSAIDLDPTQIRFYNNRGFAYYQITKILIPHVSQQGRIGLFCKTDNRFKENPMETGLLSAEVRKLLNDCIEQALANFSKILKMEPDDTTALIWRGNVLIDLGRFDEALEDFERVKSVTNDSGLLERVSQDILHVNSLIN